MTQTPDSHDAGSVRPHGDPQQPAELLDSSQAPGAQPSGEAIGAAPSSPASGRRRGLIAGAVLAVTLIGGGIAYGVGQLSGGGARPDEAVPASALAIVSVDLDPSAGQKLDALRFARAFPELKKRIGSGDDLRKLVFDAISDSSELTASWDDVEPWLGDRAAVAVLPAADELDDPVPVVVLAVTDEARARQSLPTVVPDAACEVARGFALCAQDAAVAERAVSDAAAKPLADDDTYAEDREELGDPGVLSAWLDLSRLHDAAPDLLSGVGGLGGMAGALAGASDELSGRYVAAVRFDGPTLELVGRVSGPHVPQLGGSTDVASLPQDTLAALGIGDAGAAVQSAWDRLRDAAAAVGGAEAMDEQISSLAETYGVRLPDDLVAAVGDQLTVAVGPGSAPRVAVRVDGSSDSIDRLLSAAERAAGAPSGLATAKDGDDTVIASDESYAAAVADGGGLGDVDRFRAAVPDRGDAQAVLFVDIATLVSAYGDQLGLDTAAMDELKPLSALGVSAHSDDGAVEFSVRLVTR